MCLARNRDRDFFFVRCCCCCLVLTTSFAGLQSATMSKKKHKKKNFPICFIKKCVQQTVFRKMILNFLFNLICGFKTNKKLLKEHRQQQTTNLRDRAKSGELILFLEPECLSLFLTSHYNICWWQNFVVVYIKRLWI